MSEARCRIGARHPTSVASSDATIRAFGSREAALHIIMLDLARPRCGPIRASLQHNARRGLPR